MKYADDRLKVFTSHRAALVDYVTPITGCRSRAEDVVQDAFLRYMPLGVEGASASGAGYLYRIVRNLAIDTMRRSSMEARYLDSDAVTWLEPAGQASPEELALFEDQVRRVASTLSELPDKERLALEMHRFGEYTLAEIGERLGVSVATAHRMVRSALVRVAKGLETESSNQ